MSVTISYDVFDTVVTRAFAHPRDVFVRVGEIAAPLLPGLTPAGFATARWEAELATRQRTPHQEVRLDEIYDTLAAKLGWDETAKQTVRQVELDLEGRMLRAVPRVAAELTAARGRAGRILFLSDMYLPSPVLGTWLERLAIMAPADRLFISGEMRGNKYSGRLFAAVRDAAGADFASWQHTGDHPAADVEKPRSLGITCSQTTRVHLTRRERVVRGTPGEFATPWRSLLAGAIRLARLEGPPDGDRPRVLWETGTTIAGPLFYGFVRWTLREAARRGLRRLHFLARDGQILLRIAREIQQAEGGDLECRYLHVSRLVLAGPIELESAASFRDFIAPSGGFHSLRQALALAGLEAPAVTLPGHLAALDPEANLTPGNRTALADWLLLADQQVLVRAALARRRKETRAYLAAQGLGDGLPQGVVDTGWLGTSQKNLERLLAEGPAPFPLTGFYLGLLPAWSPAAQGEMLGFTNQFGPLPLVRDESHKVMLELMAQGDHGQVAGFRHDEHTWSPILRDPGPVNLAEIRLFQDAIMAFVRRLLDVNRESPAPDDELARVVLSLYRDFHDHPSPEEARIFGGMPHADHALEQSYAAMCEPMTLRKTLGALLDHRRRPPHWWIEGQAALGQAWLLRTFVALKTWRWRLGGRTE